MTLTLAVAILALTSSAALVGYLAGITLSPHRRQLLAVQELAAEHSNRSIAAKRLLSHNDYLEMMNLLKLDAHDF